ncbi:hypothetical protein HYH02_015184 [Chlamydomonas schloesseri]|uniref:Rhamnogalacturonase A/B/Epimerase-like pectate lyase domain-containing protein n=1 Tax=Chlamydomonas schloesseri TaxID=2026947 RepID=A0A835SL43_9CHLO|nr:hypothetical protein HYH02_015184 [Chlamydomonas schloesseri]|eukprot:KAG2424324.1 hypothetical protein HYH02_015184 [Chlamydomonas schloesseri]
MAFVAQSPKDAHFLIPVDVPVANVDIATHVLPVRSGTADLGNVNLQFRDLHLSSNAFTQRAYVGDHVSISSKGVGTGLKFTGNNQSTFSIYKEAVPAAGVSTGGNNIIVQCGGVECEDYFKVLANGADARLVVNSHNGRVGVGMHVPEYKLDVDGNIQLFVQNKKKQLSNYVNKFNVRDYGAIGDGLADDTDAINAALLAAASNDMLYFPAGMYKNNQLDGIALIETCQRCVISSNFVTMNCLTGGLGGISIDKCSAVAVLNNVVTLTKTDRPGFCTPNNQGPSSRLQVNGNHFADNMGGGVFLRTGPGGATTYSHVVNNLVQNNAVFGIRVDDGSVWNIVSHNQSIDNTASAANNVINAGGVNNEVHRNMSQRPLINKLDMHDNLGVNTRTPEYPLDINGSAILRERFDVDGSIEVRGAKSTLRGNTVAPIRVLVGPTNPGSLLNGIVVENTTNTANQHAVLALRTAGTAAGNPYVAYDVAGNVQSWTHGIDQADKGKFKLRTGLTFPAGVDRMTVEPAGAVLITGNSLCVNGSVQDGQDGTRILREANGNVYVDVRNTTGPRGFIFRTGTTTGTETVLTELDGQAGAIRLNGNTAITGTNHTCSGNVAIQGTNVTVASDVLGLTNNSSTLACNTLAVTAAVSAQASTPALSLFGNTTAALSGATLTVGNTSTASLALHGTSSTHTCNTLAVTATVSTQTSTPALSLFGTTTAELSGATLTVGNVSTASLALHGTSSTHTCNTLAITAAVSTQTSTPALSLFGTTTAELSGATLTVGNVGTASLALRGTSSTHTCNTLAVTAAVSAQTSTPTLNLFGTTTTELSGATLTIGNVSTASLALRGTSSTHTCNTLAVTAAVSAQTSTPTLNLFGTTTAELSGASLTVGNASTTTLAIRGTNTNVNANALSINNNSTILTCNTMAVTAAVSAQASTPALSLFGTTTAELSGASLTVGNASTTTLNIRGTNTNVNSNALSINNNSSTLTCNTLAVTAAVSAQASTPALSLFGTTTAELSGATLNVGNVNTTTLNIRGTNTNVNSNALSINNNSSTLTCNTVGVTAAVSGQISAPTLSLFGTTTANISGATLNVGNASTSSLVVTGATIQTNASASATVTTPTLSLFGTTTTNIAGSTLNVGNASTTTLSIRGGSVGVTGPTTLNNSLNVSGTSTLSTLSAGSSTLSSLTVSGSSVFNSGGTMSGSFSLNGNLFLGSGNRLYYNGSAFGWYQLDYRPSLSEISGNLDASRVSGLASVATGGNLDASKVTGNFSSMTIANNSGGNIQLTLINNSARAGIQLFGAGSNNPAQITTQKLPQVPRCLPPHVTDEWGTTKYDLETAEVKRKVYRVPFFEEDPNTSKRELRAHIVPCDPAEEGTSRQPPRVPDAEKRLVALWCKRERWVAIRRRGGDGKAKTAGSPAQSQKRGEQRRSRVLLWDVEKEYKALTDEEVKKVVLYPEVLHCTGSGGPQQQKAPEPEHVAVMSPIQALLLLPPLGVAVVVPLGVASALRSRPSSLPLLSASLSDNPPAPPQESSAAEGSSPTSSPPGVLLSSHETNSSSVDSAADTADSSSPPLSEPTFDARLAASAAAMSNGSGSGEGAHAGHLRLYVEDQGTGKRSNAFCVCLKTDRSGTYITRLPPMAVGRICIGWELQGSQLVMRVV